MKPLDFTLIFYYYIMSTILISINYMGFKMYQKSNNPYDLVLALYSTIVISLMYLGLFLTPS